MSRHSNPWSSYKKLTPFEILSSLSLRSRTTTKTNERIPTTHPAKFPSGPPQENDGPRVIWLGHASIYLLLPYIKQGIREWRGVLFDPVFSKRCSPISFVGPKRRLEVPCKVEELPRVDMVFISHDHYDHLDKVSIINIEKYHRDVQYFVPTGVKGIFTKFGVSSTRITELGWWQEDITSLDSSKDDKVSSPKLKAERTIYMSSSSPTKSQSSLTHSEYQNLSPKEKTDNEIPFSPTSYVNPPTPISLCDTPPPKREVNGEMKIVCCPAQHDSGRRLLGKNKTLWCTWWIEYDLPGGKKWNCLFGGDTGYRSKEGGPSCPIFRELKDRLGSPDLALLPISHGSVLPYLSSLFPFINFHSGRLISAIHCSPYDAITVSRELEAKVTIPIHWGTWTTELGANETIRELRESSQRKNVDLKWYDELDGKKVLDTFSGVIVNDIGITIQLGTIDSGAVVNQSPDEIVRE